MSVPKWILIGAVTLFAILGGAALLKKGSDASNEKKISSHQGACTPSPVLSIPVKNLHTEPSPPSAVPMTRPLLVTDDFPNIDRIFQLFSTGPSKLPIVETITYSSSVPWLKGRPAWIADYAGHHGTSRHFIARSLNGKPDYLSQKVSEGSRFNVFRSDKKIEFYLLVDVSRCKMGFYYVDLDTNERVLLKVYRVGLGKLDPKGPSGTLTPLGRFPLGERIAIYKPGMMGLYQDKRVEMVQVFGTRWIPFDQGYGLQGAPWVDTGGGQLIESKACIGAYDSDGCIRMTAADIEELFSIVITKPSYLEIVKDFRDAKLPGQEVAAPSR
ncbi:MAG: L,D-transpeptidase [Verrucomicrobia bacterium]|nr:L,D-transpeptidase [Verrucomicrobiota bacterium]